MITSKELPKSTPPYVSIVGVGYQLGEEIVDNYLMSKKIEQAVRRKKSAVTGSEYLSENEMDKFLTSPDWILERTGIETRYFTNHPTSWLASEAIKKAVIDSGRKLQDLQFIIVATVTRDYLFTAPPTSTVVHGNLGLSISDELSLKDCVTFEVGNACTSFGPALLTAYSLIKAGYQFGVVVGADKMSSAVDPADRNFRILLGDGAGALCLEATTNPRFNSFPYGKMSFFSGTDPSGAKNIIASAGGSAQELTMEILLDSCESLSTIRPDRLWQDGKKVLKEISKLMPQVIETCVQRAGAELKDIDLIFPHQANLRINNIIDEGIKQKGFTGLVYNTISKVGNTTSAAVPIGICLALEDSTLKPNMTILSTPFGAGYTWSCSLIRWTANTPC